MIAIATGEILRGLLLTGGVFASIRDDREVFEAVAVEREFGTGQVAR
ncbi:MAG: hypothetical protein MSC31_19145 [Solirubrobacteraceae bacterium MAG38_C4-C5]|nr:hypothetical protein [Candidatus Siliceabacter maunaloa]